MGRKTAASLEPDRCHGATGSTNRNWRDRSGMQASGLARRRWMSSAEKASVEQAAVACVPGPASWATGFPSLRRYPAENNALPRMTMSGGVNGREPSCRSRRMPSDQSLFTEDLANGFKRSTRRLKYCLCRPCRAPQCRQEPPRSGGRWRARTGRDRIRGCRFFRGARVQPCSGNGDDDDAALASRAR